MEQMRFFQDQNKQLLLGLSPTAGEGLSAVEAGVVDAAVEKHIPVVGFVDDQLEVRVGSVTHPMQPEHYIEWIFVQTATGGQLRTLSPGDAPSARFPIAQSEIVGVWAYCNLHGLWKADESSFTYLEEMVCSPEFPEGCK